ncbi:hypothetical protein [Streptomyces sp. CL12-4]|uniref:hypothetical protein n=1 Tax=Streptomyces sp. CL12-4 TaxID=2810306 RepID=UPI001EFACB76|nr:hypothetical protein [Streptomyces sp. CL12-4]MCG8971796.1 hypothetical protein [Streptomyces sp. CL12-4]
MGRHIWGKTVAALVLAVTVGAVSGCGSSGEDSDKKPAVTAAAKADTVSLAEATTAFQDAVVDFDVSGGCESMEPGTCFAGMETLIEPARTLRKAMNAEKSVGPDFWTEAYVLIDRMEKGVAVGVDQGGGLGNVTSNRPEVFGSAHELSRWLDAHPLS